MGKFIDLTGQRFGRLVVIERTGSNKQGDVMWRCKCDCGTIKEVTATHLRSGASKSCGCLRKEITQRNRTTHGMKGTRLYNIWSSMKRRCSPSCDKRVYDRYYGRGIRVCDEWKDDFSAFAKWALSNGYSDELSIDRIDNDGNYEPSNCRWADMEEQGNNRNNSRCITCRGETLTISQWARKIGMHDSNLRRSLKQGKTIEEILEERGL